MIRTVVAAATVLLLAACGSAAGGPRAHPPERTTALSPLPGWRVAPGQFVSLRYTSSGTQVIALSDAGTGAIVRPVLPDTSPAGLQVSGLALDRAGDLWITYSKGPDYGGHVANGDPHPHTCANEIDVVHAGTGRVTVFLRTGDNVLIRGAAPSPDGRRLVYTESACTGYFDSYLRVTDLRSGRTWTIGQQLPACHLLISPSWSADGQALLVAYGPPSQADAPQDGPCPMWWAGRLVRLDASAPAPGLAGATVRADPGCQITSVAGTAGGGMLAIEGCGTAPEFADGQAQLLVLTASAHVTRRFTLGNCTDGNELAPSQSGTGVLVSAYLYCNPPGNPGPVTRLWEYRDGTLRPITGIAGDALGAELLAWP